MWNGGREEEENGGRNARERAEILRTLRGFFFGVDIMVIVGLMDAHWLILQVAHK